MFLTRLSMDLKSSSAKRDFQDCNEMHRTVMSGFQHVNSANPRQQMMILYRMVLCADENVLLYIQSGVKPDVSKWLEKGYLASLNPKSLIIEIPKPKDIFREGLMFDFNILLCPTKKIDPLIKQRLRGNKYNSIRVFLRSESERLKWFAHKAECGGFKIIESNEAYECKVYGKHSSIQGEMYHIGVCFNGILEVLDAEKFQETVYQGIGPGKSYGFGLMMLK